MSTWPVHSRQVVDVDVLDLDAVLWQRTRTALAQVTMPLPPLRDGQPVVPVVERDGRLLVLGEFELVAAARTSGLRRLTVQIYAIGPGADLLEWAFDIALAQRLVPPG